MDFIKQYILQSITAAAGNLRLNNQRIESIAILKEAIVKSNDIKHDLNQMKKITELSKFAIKLSEIHSYLSEGTVDFLRLSDKFKEHSFNLIKELNNMLDLVEPNSIKQKLENILEPKDKTSELIVEHEHPKENIASSNSIIETIDENSIVNKHGIETNAKIELRDNFTDKTEIDENKNNKTEIGEDISFDSFESVILKPIKAIDLMLTQFTLDSELPPEIEAYAKQMAINAELSLRNGFEILAQMHKILSKGLMHIQNKTLKPSKEVIESLRACLIVIVAVVKSKEVDIRNYHNRAEVFGKFLNTIKTEGK